MEKTVEGVTRAAFLNQGQVCLCGSRILVQSGIYDDFVDSFVNSVDDTRSMRAVGAREMPWWIPLALFGTFITFISFAFNALVFLVLQPTLHRFVFSEGVYVVLSLTSKVWLGALVYVNLII